MEKNCAGVRRNKKIRNKKKRERFQLGFAVCSQVWPPSRTSGNFKLRESPQLIYPQLIITPNKIKLKNNQQIIFQIEFKLKEKMIE